MTEQVRVLLVEDDVLIAMDLEDDLADAGFAVHHAPTVAKAQTILAQTPPAVAVLDMHLRSETTFDLATDLRARGVPFFFLSGNDVSALPPHLADSRILTKPVNMSEVEALVAELVA